MKSEPSPFKPRIWNLESGTLIEGPRGVFVNPVTRRGRDLRARLAFEAQKAKYPDAFKRNKTWE